MAYTPTDIFYITLSSADDPQVTSSNFPGTFQSEFQNFFPQTLDFTVPGKKLKVALVSVTYKLLQTVDPQGNAVPTFPTAFVNTNAVVSNIVVGNSFTNNIGRLLLDNGSGGQVKTQQWVAETLYWYDASQSKFAQMDCSITYDRIVPGTGNSNVQMDPNSVTYVTLAFKLE